MDAILVHAHLVVTLVLVGLIWTVQLVVYPQFAAVGKSEFVGYHDTHMWRIGRLVGPLMVVELAASLGLVVLAPTSPLRWTGLALAVGLWLLTALLQVPLHRRLAAGRNPDTIRALVQSNWLRTVGWTARGILAMLIARGV